jgi:hypothetical protein
MIQRLLERAAASGRIDDNAESIDKRLRTFREGNKAVEEHLEQKSPFKTVSCGIFVHDSCSCKPANTLGYLDTMQWFSR